MPVSTSPSHSSPGAEEPAVLEVATFRARPGLTPDDVARALRRVQPWLERQPGFLSRRVAHDAASGVWVDTIGWRSAADAKRAMAASPGAPGMAELAAAIDEASAQCVHASPVSLGVAP